VAVPEWLRKKEEEAGRGDHLKGIEFLQFTLVDCPGHAGLMKTVIGGASIIDIMVLVVDCQKLIQTQTAECLVLGEILMD
jgi:selenocysteine-specific elongation factor